MVEEKFLEELRKEIEEAEKAIAVAKERIEKAEAAGIDVTKEREELDALIADVERMKAAYFG